MRATVLRAIVATCEHRGWDLNAAHVRTEHVHVVVRALDRAEPVMNAFKVWATRYLRDVGLVGCAARVWARHGSTVWLWNESAIRDAAHYVYERPGEPMARYP